MWFDTEISNEEIIEKYNKLLNKFKNDNRKIIPQKELIKAISEEFNIPKYIIDAYVTIGFKHCSNDWTTILDNTVRLIKKNNIIRSY